MIGANTMIDRGAMSDTVIGEGTKIDNLVQIAHNVLIGRCSSLATAQQRGVVRQCGDGAVIADQPAQGEQGA